MSTHPPTLEVLSDVGVERARQEAKCREQRLLGRDWWTAASDKITDHEKFAILSEEIGEIARELCESRADLRRPSANLRTELVQAAAICVAWAESLDSRPHE